MNDCVVHLEGYVITDIKPGDILIVRSKDRLSPEVGNDLVAQIAKLLPGVKVMVVDSDADIAVLRRSEVGA